MKYCVKCGNQMNDDDLFCSKCGEKDRMLSGSIDRRQRMNKLAYILIRIAMICVGLVFFIKGIINLMYAAWIL